MAFVNDERTHLRQSTLATPDTALATYSISDLAREFNVSLRALRFYEDKRLLEPQRRGVSRAYSNLDRLRLQMILKGKKLGFTLSEIRDMAMKPDQVLSQISLLERQRLDLDQAITELRATHRRLASGDHQAA